eukprot:scaffold306_cov525-Prasinococcus_capsulatus_cf.AAC.14
MVHNVLCKVSTRSRGEQWRSAAPTRSAVCTSGISSRRVSRIVVSCARCCGVRESSALTSVTSCSDISAALMLAATSRTLTTSYAARAAALLRARRAQLARTEGVRARPRRIAAGRSGGAGPQLWCARADRSCKREAVGVRRAQTLAASAHATSSLSCAPSPEAPSSAKAEERRAAPALVHAPRQPRDEAWRCCSDSSGLLSLAPAPPARESELVVAAATRVPTARSVQAATALRCGFCADGARTG